MASEQVDLGEQVDLRERIRSIVREELELQKHHVASDERLQVMEGKKA